ncbi:glycosyltransferase [Paenibacillus sp. MMS18-CY102]|uniref:glycosyltransferase n=1 Tax=Paenibacillus sp. MMS18-CY102 TaxID=2682849 RepID=UPI001365F1CA|nr:glycosyltransferase [Paenibacillus sp. MMS18-CY102]
MNISVCLIVKDEESNIVRVLRSIPERYEVIVLDTGSLDRTPVIAAAMGAKVYHYRWNNNFSDARNQSIQYATQPHVLILDADEVLPPSAEKLIDEYLIRFSDFPAAVIIHNFQDQESTNHRMVRLFPNNSRFHYKGMVHEQLHDNDKLASFKMSEIRIDHYGYEKDEYASKGKFERYIRLYRMQLEAEPSGYMYYQLGKLYYSNQQFGEAYNAFQRAIEFEEYQRPYFPPMLVQFGYSLKELGFVKEAIEIINPFQEEYPDFPDLPFLLGTLSMEKGDLEEMKNYFEKALLIGETNDYSTSRGSGSYKAAHNLGVYYEVMGKANVAVKYYKEAASYNYDPSLMRLKELQ